MAHAPMRAAHRRIDFRSGARLLLIGAAVCFLAATGAFAAQPNGAATPRSFVDSLGVQALGIIKSSDMTVAQREQRFRSLFDNQFDVPAIGRFVLGSYWNRTNNDQRKRYLDLFSQYVATLYAVQFSHYAGQTFKTLGTQPVGRGDTAVNCEIDQSGQQPLHLIFRVRNVSGNLKIVDVTVEGVSLIVTKRSEFSAVLSQRGLDGVMQGMKKVVNQASSGRQSNGSAG